MAWCETQARFSFKDVPPRLRQHHVAALSSQEAEDAGEDAGSGGNTEPPASAANQQGKGQQGKAQQPKGQQGKGQQGKGQQAKGQAQGQRKAPATKSAPQGRPNSEAKGPNRRRRGSGAQKGRGGKGKAGPGAGTPTPAGDGGNSSKA